MDISVLLARVIGITFIVMYAGLLLNFKLYRRFVTSITEHPVILFLSGFISLVLGLLIIQVHNIWVFDWQGIITFLGWLLVFGGICRILFPQFVLKMSKKLFESVPEFLQFLSAILCLLGLYLVYVGFTG